MKLYIDLETLQLIEGPGFRNPVSSLRFKRGDAAQLKVVFLQDATSAVEIGDPASLELQFGIKPRGRYDVGYLVQEAVWTLPDAGAENPSYLCTPSFNTLELDSAMQVGSSTGSELSEITLMGEITWREGAGEPTSTRTFTVVVENDVNRGTEGTPTELPYADDWLDARAIRFDKALSLTPAQQRQALANIDGRETFAPSLSLKEIAAAIHADVAGTHFLDPHPDSNGHIADSVRSDRPQSDTWSEQTNCEVNGTACIAVKDDGTSTPQTFTMTGLTPGQNYSVWAVLYPGTAGYVGGLFGKFTRANDWDGRIAWWGTLNGEVAQRPEDRVVVIEDGCQWAGNTRDVNYLFLGNQVANGDGEVQFDFCDSLTGSSRVYLFGGAVGKPHQPHIPSGVDVIWEDGTWNWFSTPVGVVLSNGNYLVGLLGADGKASAINFNPTTKAGPRVDLSSWAERDDHDNPAFATLSDGNILSAYTRHSTVKSTEHRISTNANPDAIGDWGAEQIITAHGSTQYAYVKLFRDPSSDRVFYAHRALFDAWYLSWSDDDGSNWGTFFALVSQENPDNWSCYPHFAVDATGNIHVLVQAGDAPSQLADGECKHFYYDPDTDIAYDSAGSQFLADVSTGGPVQSDNLPEVSTVFPHLGQFRHNWVSDIQIDPDTGNPVCVGISLRRFSARASFDYTGGLEEDLWTIHDVGLSGHGLKVGDKVKFTTVGTGATGYDGNTTYHVVDVPTRNTVRLADAEGGAVVAGSADSAGTWVMAHTGITDRDDILYWYSAWDGAAWNREVIARGGCGIAPDRSGYAGELVLNPLDTSQVVMSSNAAEPFELKKNAGLIEGDPNSPHEIHVGKRSSEGLWTWEQWTHHSGPREHNVRPQIITNADKTAAVAVWLQCLYSSGGFNSIESRILAKTLT